MNDLKGWPFELFDATVEPFGEGSGAPPIGVPG